MPVDETSASARRLIAAILLALAAPRPGFAQFGSGPDCNQNGAADADDIAAGTSLDCNQNGFPDECDLAVGPTRLLAVERFSRLVSEVDPATGTLFPVGSMGPEVTGAFSIAVHPRTREIYALTTQDGPDAQHLARVDRVSGLATLLGAFGDLYADMAFSSDGTLYVIQGNLGPQPGVVFTVDLVTTSLSPTAIDTGQGAGHSIAFHPETGRLFHAYAPTFAASLLQSFDVATGAASVINPALSDGPITAMAFHPSASPLLLFAIDTLYDADATDGTMTLMGGGTITVTGLAWLPGSADCNINATPDECEPDCNQSGSPDFCDARGDLSGDGAISAPDSPAFMECVTGPCANPPCQPALYANACCALADFDSDGDVDLSDGGAFARAFEG